MGSHFHKDRAKNGRQRLLCSVALSALMLAAMPADAETIAARGGTHDNFDRIVFDWPRATKYHITRKADQLSIEFSSAADINLRALTSAQLTRARGLKVSADGDKTSVSFTIAPQAKISDFTSGNSIVIDVNGPAASATAATAASAEKPAPEKTEIAKTEAAKTETPKSETPAPVAEAAKPPAPPAPPAAPASTKETTAKDAAVKDREIAAKISATAPSPTPTAATSTTATPATPAATPVTPAPTPETKTPETKAAESNTAPTITPPSLPTPAAATPPAAVGTSRAGTQAAPVAASHKNPSGLEIGYAPELVLTLDPKLPIGSVIFKRGAYGYIFFDRKLTIDVPTLIAGQTAPRVKLEPIDLPHNSGYRFAVPVDVDMRATRNDNSWQIYLSKQPRDITVSTSLVAQPDFALGARLLLPVTEPPEPIRFNDGDIGDDLILVPLHQTEAFSVSRNMADYIIVPSAQGLVIKPRHEKVLVRAIADGIEITAEGGLRLSPSIDTGSVAQSTQKAKDAANGKSLFDFTAWGGKSNETFSVSRQRLMQTIVDVPQEERNRARLELARFYFAHGMGEEALGMMKFLVSQVSDLASHSEFLALRGAAKILADHPEDGLRDLDDPELNFQPEIELWRGVASAEMRDWKTAEENFARTESILNGYPEPFYSRFYVLAIEAAINSGKDREAAEWLDRLQTQSKNEEVQPAINYLRGVLQSKSGRSQVAKNLWEDVRESHDRLYKIRAELALLDLAIATNSMTAAQAAERLEGLRFAWRGDELELDILHRLGQFYIEAKNVRAALGVLGQALRLYPDSPMTPMIRTEMGAAFRSVFLGDASNAMSPLEVLTLYQQYRELMPKGEESNSIVRSLAERLVAIDLLDQASALLEDQVKNHLEGENKARAAARLSAIRLLDHKPDLALAALDLGKIDNIPADLANERELLRARALSEEHKEEDALALLKNNNSKPAKMLRADITMRGQKWTDAAAALLELIGPPPKPGESLPPESASWIISAATAMAMAGDTAGLDKLAVEFSAAMSGTTQIDTFRVLTRPEKVGQLRDIAAAQSKITEVDMFRGFLDSYRAAPTPAPDDKKPASTAAP